ncbi:GTPase Era [Candidatus Dependentiae bacterium]|nr:GTPase Era [Candidatus Dependentiae bacterium]
MKKNKNTDTTEFKSGFVSITGLPNAGKSTLMNKILGEKIAITSPKPQTTRFQIRGIFNDSDSQIVLIDTPGIHKTKHQLGKYMIKEIVSSFIDVSAVLIVIDLETINKTNISNKLLEHINFLEKTLAPKILVLNKVDKIKKDELIVIIKQISETYKFDDIVPVSALRGYNLDTLINVIKKYLKNSERFFDSDIKSDLSDSIYISELVREKIIGLTKEEIPHSVTCKTEVINEKNNKSYIRVIVYVERDSQKGIIIGKKGQMLKKIGEISRKEIEEYIDRPAYLEIQVKVLENWRHNDSKLKEIGY